ncbi:uncharacterized protein LOC116295742 [Actinia tenebrosa]|uniref:Uncharacterized protein LOC116295742 n=1 Tax=Actinia tenebrosa TaxID=6105 RepID=A0A6P8HVV9_ACTTE|nr:uncharacterized protein LOC116295742 [Actinia tenebrosa]
MKNILIAVILALQGFLSVKVYGFQFNLLKTSDWQYPGRCLDLSLQMTLTSDTPIKISVKSPFNQSAAFLKIKETTLKSSTCGQFTGSSNAVLGSRVNNPDINDEATIDLGNVAVPSTCDMAIGVKFQLLDHPSFTHGQSVWVSIGTEYANQSIFAAQQAIRTMNIAVPQPVLHVSVSSPGADVMDAGSPMILQVRAYHDCAKTSAHVEKSRIIIEPPKNVQYSSFQKNTGSVDVTKTASSGSELIFETGAINFTQEINFNLTVTLDTSQPKTGRELQYVTFYVDVSANGSSPLCTSPNKEFSETSSLTTTSVIYRPFSTCDSAIGLTGGAFSASSYSAGNEPHHAKLNGPGAWKPSNAFKKDRRQYLQANFTSRLQIRRLVTKGLCDVFGNSTDAFVKAFKLYYSENGAFWNAVKEGSKVKVFSANKGCEKSTIVPLPFDVEAKYLRLVPVDFENEIALKLEVYGCVATSSAPAVPTDIPNRSLIPRLNDIFVCNTGMDRKTVESSCHYSSDGLSWKALHFSIKHISHYDPTTDSLYGVGGSDGKLKFRSGTDINKAWDVISSEEFTSKKAVSGAVMAVSADHLVVTDTTTSTPLTADRLAANAGGITWGWTAHGVHSSNDGGTNWNQRVSWSCKDLAP